MIRRWVSLILPPLLVLIVFIGASEAYIRWRNIPIYLAAPPSAVQEAMVEYRPELLGALLQTTEATLIGFAASVVLGILIAVLLASAKIVRNAFYPYTVFFQTVPVVAIAPLLVNWFGTGLLSVAICAFVVSVFPVIANTLAGLLSTDPALADMFKLYGANPVARLFKLRLPWAMPSTFTGLRIAAGLSVIGTIVGEFITGDLDTPGLGVLILSGIKNSKTAMAFAAILLASLLGLAMMSLLNLAGYLMLRHWHASARD